MDNFTFTPRENGTDDTSDIEYRSKTEKYTVAENVPDEWALKLCAFPKLLAVCERFILHDTGRLMHGPLLHDDFRAAIAEAKGE